MNETSKQNIFSIIIGVIFCTQLLFLTILSIQICTDLQRRRFSMQQTAVKLSEKEIKKLKSALIVRAQYEKKKELFYD